MHVCTAFVHSGVSVLCILFFLQCNKMQLTTLLVLAGLVVVASAHVIGRPNADSEEDQISSTYYHIWVVSFEDGP